MLRCKDRLIRRFGSKEGLLHALTQRWIETAPVATTETGDAHAELQAHVEATFATLGARWRRAGGLGQCCNKVR